MSFDDKAANLDRDVGRLRALIRETDDLDHPVVRRLLRKFTWAIAKRAVALWVLAWLGKVK